MLPTLDELKVTENINETLFFFECVFFLYSFVSGLVHLFFSRLKFTVYRQLGFYGE